MHNIFSDLRRKTRDIYFSDNIAECSNPRRWYSISLYNVGWECQTEDAHVATCCVTSYWLSNRYTKAAEVASFSMQAHQNARAQDVQFLCKLAATQVPGITRCQLCHLPYSRDSRLDLSRLSPRHASFRVWSASLSLSFLLCFSVFYVPLFSSSPPPFSLSQFSAFCIYLVLGQGPSRLLPRYEYARATTAKYVWINECTHSSGLVLKSADSTALGIYSEKFYFCTSRSVTKQNFRSSPTRIWEDLKAFKST